MRLARLTPCSPRASNKLASAPADRRLRTQRRAHFLLGWPPVRTFDLGNAIADDVGRRLDLVEAPRIGAEEFRLILLREPVLLHCLDGPPGIIAVVMVDIGRPAQDVAVKFRQAGRRRLVAFEAGHAMLEEGLARQLFQRRPLPLIAVNLVGPGAL